MEENRPKAFSIQQVKEWMENGIPKEYDQNFQLRFPPSGGSDGDISPPRTPLLLPESVMLMVCPSACGRHGALGNREAEKENRYYMLRLMEHQIVTGSYMKVIEEAANEIMETHIPTPKVLFLCGTCMDVLLASDYEPILKRLETKWGIRCGFTRMEPILNKVYIPGERRTLKNIYGILRSTVEQEKLPAVNIIGRDMAIPKESDLWCLLKQAGIEKLCHITQCRTVKEVDQMTRSVLNIGVEPRSKDACQEMEKRLGIPWILLENSYDPDDIHNSYMKLSEKLGNKINDSQEYIRAVQQLKELKNTMNGKRIAVGEGMDRRPFKAVKDLVKWGISVETVFTRFLDREDKENVKWLCTKSPDLKVYMSSLPEMILYAQNPENYDFVLGLSEEFYMRASNTKSFSPETRYPDYYTIRNLVKGIKTAKTAAEKTESDKQKIYLEIPFRESAFFKTWGGK